MKRRVNTRVGAGVAAIMVCAILGLVAGFVPDASTNTMRRKISTRVVQPQASDMPRPAVADFTMPWQWRASAGDMAKSTAAPVPNATSAGAPTDAGSMVYLGDDGVSVSTADGKRLVSRAEDNPVSPVLGLDGGRLSPLLAGVMPVEYGEPLDGRGRPLRWMGGKDEFAARLAQECRQPRIASVGGVMRILRREFGSVDSRAMARAGMYQRDVERFARAFGLRPRLVYAIMHTESGFDPVAESRASARGLMQVVPGTAGEEVRTFLNKRGDNQNDVDLFVPANNIKYGTAYLYLLLNRHFAEIRQSQSRELCAIAAYNGGPGRVLRVFNGDRDKALAIINDLTPQQVYDKLVRKMPRAESREYVDKVLASLDSFSVKQ